MPHPSRWAVGLITLLLFLWPFSPAATIPSPQEAGRATDYLGETLPGDEPVLFSPGIVSTEEGMYGTVVFSPDQTEAFWAKDEHPGLFRSHLVDGRWTLGEEAPLLPGHRLSSPFYSPDGNRLYFMAKGRNGSGLDERERIWVAERTSSGWGEPRDLHLGEAYVPMHWQFSLEERGTLYFMGEGADLYVSVPTEDGYADPVLLPPPINTEAPESSPHISLDGTILLFDRWFQSSPFVRIMVSFKDSRGAWSEPVDLSTQIGSEGNDSCARLTPDGSLLFFQSVRAGSDPNRSVYWMDAGFLKELRDEVLQ